MPVRRLAAVAVLAAASAVAMMTVHFPIVPSATFLKYDPSDAGALLAGFWMGPGPGVLAVLIKDVLFWLIRGGNPLGPLADFMAAGTFVGVAAWVYRLAGRGRPAAPIGALVPAIVIGTLARVLVMVGANFPILYVEFGMAPQRVASLLLPAIIPFNGLKGLLNGALAAVLVAALSRRAQSVAAWLPSR